MKIYIRCSSESAILYPYNEMYTFIGFDTDQIPEGWTHNDVDFYIDLFERKGLKFKGFAVIHGRYYDLAQSESQQVVGVDSKGHCWAIYDDSMLIEPINWRQRYDVYGRRDAYNPFSRNQIWHTAQDEF